MEVVPEGIQLFADTIQLVKSSAEPASTVLETAALQSMRLDHHISINL
jgi:hypothetical protein